MTSPATLPKDVEEILENFVEAARSAFEENLSAVVLYGSAAEGKLRSTSDVNTLLVLKAFHQEQADRFREPMRIAHATIQMNTMFVLETELTAAIEAFTVKFSDIVARHQLLYGEDPFSDLSTTKESLIKRLEQELLNLQLRLRERYILTSLREEQLALVVADITGPLRASAASLWQVEAQQVLSPKQALERIVEKLQDSQLDGLLPDLSSIREGNLLPGKTTAIVMKMLHLIQRLRERTERLKNS